MHAAVGRRRGGERDRSAGSEETPRELEGGIYVALAGKSHYEEVGVCHSLFRVRRFVCLTSCCWLGMMRFYMESGFELCG